MELSLITAAAVDSAPAGGAAIWEAVVATLVGIGVTLALLVLGWAHRSGRTRALRRAADQAAAITGLPYWAALPTAIVTGSLIVAAVGMYWDISIHIDQGRDDGPFANGAHFLILGGLFGVFSAGLIALVLPERRHGSAFVRIREGWYAPLGSIGLLVASGFALSGFPLDDLWHRIFGQDVTLWGPTHLMLIGGAALAFIGQATLLGEAAPHEVDVPASGRISGRIRDAVQTLRYPALAGGFLIGLSTFQAEFDFGVPQFRLLFAPVLIAFAAATALTAARIYGGRGGAVLAALFFIGVRGLLAITVGPILGETTPHFPLYIAEAVLVELAALAISPRARPYAFGAVSGLLIATIGMAAEYGWSQVWMPVAWTPGLIGETLAVTVVVAVASGLIGAWIATCWLAPIRGGRTRRLPLTPVVAGLVALVAVVGYGLQTSPRDGVSADVRLTTVDPGPQRTVQATIRIKPAEAAAEADWLSVTAWQGGGFHLDHLTEVGPGLYRTNAPVPVHGTWKALVRLHTGSSLLGLPIYLPEDTAIPAPAVPAQARFTRSFQPDHEILQREQTDDAPGSLVTVAYAAVGSIVLAVILLLGWSLRRLALSAAAGSPGGVSSPRDARSTGIRGRLNPSHRGVRVRL